MNKMKNEKSTRMMALMLIGLMVFSTVGVFAQEGIAMLNSDSSDSVKIEILPNAKVAKINNEGYGVAYYKIVVTDNHESASVSAQDTFKYVLSFESLSEGVEGRFIEFAEIELGRMESETVELEVLTKDFGGSGFVVKVQGEDTNAYSKGRIVFGKKLIKPVLSDRAFFNGKGVASRLDNQESVYLKLLKENDNNVFGKIKIDGQDFKVKGSIDGKNIRFNIFNIKTNSVSARNSEVAFFEGTFKKYEGSILINGTLAGFEGKDWKLILVPKNIGRITNAQLGVSESYSVEFQETIAVPNQDSANAEEQVYFNLVKVKPKKFLWIFPTKKKLIELEVIKGNKVFTKKITENSRQKIEGYFVSVGDLSDEDNIEFNIEDLE